MRDTLIRDRIGLGVNNNTIRKKLLQVRSLTLKQCIDICRSDEATATQLKAISGDDSMHKIRDWRRTGKKDKHPSRDGKNDRNVPLKPGKSHKKCLFCGGEHPLNKEKCPAWGEEMLRMWRPKPLQKCLQEIQILRTPWNLRPA